MGVMVPCNEILKKAKEEKADLIGLSGLITPSLEEMAYVAEEMQRDDYFRSKKMPLMIGGATTSRVHTAVKIAPHYEGPVVYVPDASRAVSVASSLLSEEGAEKYIDDLQADYERIRVQHANKKQTPIISIEEARANKEIIDWGKQKITKPKFIGRRVFKNYDLADIAQCIDWTPFFQTWDLAGKYPQILKDEVVGDSAQKVFADAQAMLQKIIQGRWLQAHAVIGLYPANSVGDDIEIYESVFILLLNAANDTIGFAKISQGGILGTVIDVRLIAKYAIESLATSVILAHNHPTGRLLPSDADDNVTKKTKNALNTLDIILQDHLIITKDSFYSYANQGRID
jgi:cobalamin-dependent methionine synthase I